MQRPGRVSISPVVDVENPVEHSKNFPTFQVPAADLGHNDHLHVQPVVVTSSRKQYHLSLALPLRFLICIESG